MNIKKQDAKDLTKALRTIERFSTTYGINVLYNYKWREIMQGDEVESMFENFVLSPGAHQEDFTAKGFDKGELKSCKGKPTRRGGLWVKSQVKFEFDKQNDPIRRRQVLEYDTMVFSMFSGPDIIFSAIAKTEKSMAKIRQMIKSKQRDFVSLFEECQKNNKKVPRDSIRILYKDLLEVEEMEFLISGKKATKIQFKELFGD